MSHAVVVGHVCLDLTPGLGASVDLHPGRLQEIGPLVMNPGGCVANTGLALAQLGVAVRLVGDVGDDLVGALLGRLLSREVAGIEGPRSSVDLRSVRGATTSYSVVLQRPDTDRVFLHHVGANGRFDGTDVRTEGADLVHLGYPPVLPALLRGDALLSFLDRAGDATTSLDMAVVDGRGEVGRYDWSALLDRILPRVGVFSPSVDDLASALHHGYRATPETMSELAGQLVDRGAAVVTVSGGAAGIALRTASTDRLSGGGRVLAALPSSWAERELWVPALADRVTTTNGAGDAATAGLLYGLLAHQEPEDALLTAALCARAKVTGARRLPSYAKSTLSKKRVPPEHRPGWVAGQRGVLCGPSDAERRPALRVGRS